MINIRGLIALSRVALLLLPINASLAYTPSAKSLYMSSGHHGNKGAPVVASSSKPFQVVPVTSRDLYYGILVFRHRYPRLHDYQAQNNHLSRNDALLSLTKDKCDDKGQDLWFSGGERGLLTQFAAIKTKENKDFDDHCDITNSVIGAADIHVRSFERDEFPQVEIEVKNVRVDFNFRRQGIATRLMDEIQNHIRAHHSLAKVYLDVDIDNLAARALYQSKGFHDDPTESGKMTWITFDSSSTL